MTNEAADCLFCRIAAGKMGVALVAESEHAVAFRDVQPQAPTHVLVVPRMHVNGLAELDAVEAEVAADLLRLATEVARREGIVESGFRVLANSGVDAGQTVFHLHFHVLGGRSLMSGLG